MKYPLKARWPVDADGKLPSDKAYEKWHEFIARMELKYQNQLTGKGVSRGHIRRDYKDAKGE